MSATVSPTNKFIVPSTYNYAKSSESNYESPDAPFVGKYQHIRKQLDYSYHKRYGVERQHLQDQLIDRFLKTKVIDKQHNLTCEVPLENWIVFTAGPMGAGKGHTIQWLADTGLFPLDAFVNVDPDAIRYLLPETAQYNALDDKSTGHLTQKEVGYISEILSYDALQKGKNVLVDGSLRNAHWYLEYFRNLRDKFPIIKIAILHVTAKPETVLLRARNRAKVTGRHVPEETILESMRTIPESLRILSPHSEFVATFVNEDDEAEPRLAYCCMQEPVTRRCEPLAPLWCMRETPTIAPEHGRVNECIRTVYGTNYDGSSNDSGSGNDGNSGSSGSSGSSGIGNSNVDDAEGGGAMSGGHSAVYTSSGECMKEDKCYHYGQCHRNPYFEPSHLLLHAITPAALQHSSSVVSMGSGDSNGSSGAKGCSGNISVENGSIVYNSTIDLTTYTNTIANSTTNTTNATNTKKNTTYMYTLVDCEHHIEEVLCTWKGLFATTWEMKCALPDAVVGSGEGAGMSVPILSRANSANVKYAGVSNVVSSVGVSSVNPLVSVVGSYGSNDISGGGGSSGSGGSGGSSNGVHIVGDSNSGTSNGHSGSVSNGNNSVVSSASNTLTTQESVDTLTQASQVSQTSQEHHSQHHHDQYSLDAASPLRGLKRPREVEVPSYDHHT